MPTIQVPPNINLEDFNPQPGWPLGVSRDFETSHREVLLRFKEDQPDSYKIFAVDEPVCPDALIRVFLAYYLVLQRDVVRGSRCPNCYSKDIGEVFSRADSNNVGIDCHFNECENCGNQFGGDLS